MVFKFIQSIKKHNAGYTFSELMVSIAIIAIFTAVVVPSYKNINQGFTLDGEAVSIAQTVRNVQEMSMSAQRISETEPPPLGGYGIYINLSSKDRYVVFADKNDNGIYDPSSGPGGEAIETVYLDSNVEIKQINSPTQPGCCSQLIITYKPPDPIVGMLTESGPYAQNSISVELKLGNKIREVFFNKVGLVDID